MNSNNESENDHDKKDESVNDKKDESVNDKKNENVIHKEHESVTDGKHESVTDGKHNKKRNKKEAETNPTKKRKVKHYYVKQGGIGTVTIRYCSRLQREVATKHITVDQENLYRIEQEVRILEDLQDHPHIVKLYNFFPNIRENRSIIEFEKAQFDLSDYIRIINMNQLTITNQDVKQVAKDILSGLSYCHLRLIYHGDIRPANILCFSLPNGRYLYKLADFSSAYHRELSDDPNTGTTFVYSPPELLLDKSRYDTRFLPDEKTDTFSLGLLLLEFVEGHTIIWKEEWSNSNYILTRKDACKYMFNLFGLPNPNLDWKDLSSFSNWNLWKSEFQSSPSPRIEYSFKNENRIDNKGKVFIRSMLEYDPKRRKNIFECGRDAWITLPEF